MYLHLVARALSLRTAGLATVVSHKCDIPLLVKIGRTPKGAYSTRGRSRHLLETPFSEPLLRTLLRTPFSL